MNRPACFSRFLLAIILKLISTRANDILAEWLRANLLRNGEIFSPNHHYIQINGSDPLIYTGCVARRDPSRIENGGEWFEGRRFYRCLISGDGTRAERKVVACRNDLNGKRQRDGETWTYLRFILRCRLGKEFHKDEIQHIGCLDDNGETRPISTTTSWKSRFHGMALQCRHNRIIFTACLDEDLREIPAGKTFVRPGGFRYRCAIGGKGEVDRSQIVGCRIGGKDLEFGETIEQEGFTVTCQGPIQPYLRYDCVLDGYHVDWMGVVRKCEYMDGPITIHGCAPDPRDALNTVPNGFKWKIQDLDRPGSPDYGVIQRCSFHSRKESSLKADRILGGIQAVGCTSPKYGVGLGCYMRELFNDQVVFCRRRTVWSEEAATYGTLPYTPGNTQFLRYVFGLRYCGIVLPDGASALVSDTSPPLNFFLVPKSIFTALFLIATHHRYPS